MGSEGELSFFSGGSAGADGFVGVAVFDRGVEELGCCWAFDDPVVRAVSCALEEAFVDQPAAGVDVVECYGSPDVCEPGNQQVVELLLVVAGVSVQGEDHAPKEQQTVFGITRESGHSAAQTELDESVAKGLRVHTFLLRAFRILLRGRKKQTHQKRKPTIHPCPLWIPPFAGMTATGMFLSTGATGRNVSGHSGRWDALPHLIVADCAGVTARDVLTTRRYGPTSKHALEESG